MEDGALSVRKPPPPKERADIWKADGNEKLTQGDFKGALQSYTRGIEAAREVQLEGHLLSQLFSNRAQAHFRLNNFEQAVQDCEDAVKSHQGNAKAYWRGANAAMKLGKPAVAVDLCTRGIEAVGDSQGLQAMLEEAKVLMSAEATAGAAGRQDNAETKATGASEANDAATTELAQPPAASQSKGKPLVDLQQVISTQDLAERGVTLLERYRQAAEPERDEDDVIRAKRIFEKVLSQDRKNEAALIGLGEILEEGLGCEKDVTKASQLWMMAVNAGSTRAQIKMALQGLSSWAASLRAQAMDKRGSAQEATEASKPPPRRWRPGDRL